MALPSAPLDTTETAHEMARRLGISDDDPEEYEQFNVENEAHIFSSETLPAHGTEAWVRLMCSFSSHYLPRLILAILHLCPDSPLAPLYVLQLGHLLPLPFAAAYFRTHAEEARKLIWGQMEYVADLDTEVSSDDPSSTQNHTHISILHNLFFLSTLPSPALAPAGFFVPSYSLRFNVVASLRSHLRRFPPRSSFTQKMNEQYAETIRVIGFIQEDRPWRASCEGWEGSLNSSKGSGLMKGWPWDGCAMRGSGGCVRKEARELMLCSKCRSVRYCSPRHQRAHWKVAHKHQCFPLAS
ncbi:hypothetical protein BDY24DRAFT_390400 [Mrakia frigida]|uniref:zinc finger MYND domain-containing protein n=1 Tax=Mrakia frigida TaxID=29902 RepID=UPI003FCC0A19